MSTQKIVTITQSPKQKTLSSTQKQFNTFIQKIEFEKKHLRQWQDTIPAIEQKSSGEFREASDAYDNARIDFAQLLDKQYDHKLFKKKDKEKIAHIIREIMDRVLESPDFDDQIRDLYNKYNETDFDADKQENEEKVGEIMKSMMKEMFDIDLPDDFDVTNPQNHEAFIREQAQEKQRIQEEKEQLAQERKAKRKKSAKQLEKEAKQKEQEQNISKSIQEVYRQLVKTLHPDREPDEAERARKTSLMQRVNIAYEKKDLLQLLELQLETEQIDQDHLDNIAEERLKYFNKILQGQLKELQQEILAIEDSFKMRLSLPPYQRITPKQLLELLNQDIKNLKKSTQGLMDDIKLFQEPANLKQFLKDYRIPPRQDVYDLSEMMAEFEMMNNPFASRR